MCPVGEVLEVSIKSFLKGFDQAGFGWTSLDQSLTGKMAMNKDP